MSNTEILFSKQAHRVPFYPKFSKPRKHTNPSTVLLCRVSIYPSSLPRHVEHIVFHACSLDHFILGKRSSPYQPIRRFPGCLQPRFHSSSISPQFAGTPSSPIAIDAPSALKVFEQHDISPRANQIPIQKQRITVSKKQRQRTVSLFSLVM